MTHESSMPPPKTLGGRRRVVRVALILMVLVVAVGFVLSKIDTKQYAISPGGAEPVTSLITIDGKKGPAMPGKILLTDVYLTPLNWLTWLPAKVDPNVEIIPAEALIEPGVPTEQLDAQGYLQMAQSKDAARVAALTRLGYPVGRTPDGAVVTAVGGDSPSIKELHVADIITAIDASPTTNSCQVIRALHDLAPGVSVAVTFRPAVIHDNGSITHTAPVVRHLTLARPHGDAPASQSCRGVAGPNRGYLGVALDSDVAYHYPMKISISTPNIGGPSAGLAMTLGIIDRLSHGSLIRHRVMAATGTMSTDGTIGDVGGVPQKAVAVSREDATLFLVPPGELAPATSKASSSVHVVEAPTLDSALRVLLNLGGSLRMADGTTESRSHQRSTP